MKNLLFLLLVAVFPLFATAQTVELVPLKNYFVKNTVKLSKGLNCKVIKKKSDFDKNFGAAKTATNTVITPNFKDHIVLSIALPATNIATNLSYQKAELSGANLNVYCTIETGTSQSYSTTPLALGMATKNANVKYVCFYNGTKLVKKVKA